MDEQVASIREEVDANGDLWLIRLSDLLDTLGYAKITPDIGDEINDRLGKANLVANPDISNPGHLLSSWVELEATGPGPTAIIPREGNEDDSESVRPGWYEDPDHPGEQRYWDGDDWDERWSDEPAVREDIATAAKRMGYALGALRAIRKLPEHLYEEEAVCEMVKGKYGGGWGLLVLTDQRLLFVREGLINSTSEDFPLKRVDSVGFSSGLAGGVIVINAAGNASRIENVPKGGGKRLAAAARQVTGDRAPLPTAQAPTIAAPQSEAAGPATRDPIEQLKKLGELHQSGVLTDEEFAEKKTKLLEEI